jgi:hypothetical protein
MTSEKKQIEPLIVYALTVSGSQIKADFARNCETEWIDMHLNEVLSSSKIVLVGTEAEVFVVSSGPILGIATVTDMEISAPDTLSILSGCIHDGHTNSAYRLIKDLRVHYVVNDVGRIIIPAESPLATSKEN